MDLVGGLVAICYFPIYKGNLIIPIDEVIFFRGVQPQPPTVVFFCGAVPSAAIRICHVGRPDGLVTWVFFGMCRAGFLQRSTDGCK